LARLTLDEPKAFVYSQRPNCSSHWCISDLWCLTSPSISTRPTASLIYWPDRRSTAVAEWQATPHDAV